MKLTGMSQRPQMHQSIFDWDELAEAESSDRRTYVVEVSEKDQEKLGRWRRKIGISLLEGTSLLAGDKFIGW